MLLARTHLRPLGAATAVSLLVPATALAHGIGGSAVDKSVAEFVPLGMLHMLAGWDHLLFIAGVVLLARDLRSAARLISLFVAGHSITLLAATLAGFALDATVVDVVIALSVLYVGIQGLRGGLGDGRPMGATVFGFGLVHGLGLSTRLQDLGLPEGGLVPRVFAFNVGVEIGQLIAIAVIVGLGAMVARRLEAPERFVRPAFGAIATSGLVAAAVLSFPAGSAEREDDRAGSGARAAAPRTDCVRTDAEPPPFAGGGHPVKRFFEPGDPLMREEDLTHVIGDGYAILRYRADLPDGEREQLRTWVEGADGMLVGAPAPDQAEPITVTAAYRRLTCSTFDVESARAFSERWFADVRAGTYR